MRISKIVDVENVRRMAITEGYDPNRILAPTQKGKKLSYLTPDNRRVNFGSSEYESYDKHKDETRKDKYLKRATNIKGDWKKDKYSPNNLAIKLLWSPKTKL
jgi:hypothetical protein